MNFLPSPCTQPHGHRASPYDALARWVLILCDMAFCFVHRFALSLERGDSCPCSPAWLVTLGAGAIFD